MRPAAEVIDLSSMVTHWSTCCWVYIIAWCLWADLAPAQPPAALNVDDFRHELERLDGICVKVNLTDERKLMSSWIVADRSDAHLLFLPIEADPLNVRPGAPTAAAHSSWLKHFATARTRHAQHWFETAQQQATSGDEWSAYLSLWRAAREDNAHTETKRVLGTLLAALTVRGKPRPVTTVHPKFNWPGGTYSRMETANFKITSRADAAKTQQIAAQLETFFALWTQSFYPLWAAPGVTNQRISGRNTNWQRKHQVDVVLCKDRDDYLKTLGVAESNIGVSVGYYSPDAQMSFFYPDENLDATLYHELTHQLLAEVSQLKGTSQAGDKSHFWLIEAVALYMESLTPAENHWRLGGWLAPRMQGARYRALHDGYWIEPKDLDAIGMEGWKERDDIARVYTHAAGLAHFFMDRRLPPVDRETSASDQAGGAAGGAAGAEMRLNDFDADTARAAFFSSLIAVYRGDQPPEKLWQVAGDEQAQQDYVHFQLVRDRHVQSLAQSGVRADAITELVLARSRLSLENWLTIGQFKQLHWLEASYCNARPADLRWLKDLTKLERLSLEGVEIDEQLLADVGALPKLKELDLTQCEVDDRQLLVLKKCTSLESLWLGGTKVSAESLAWIQSLPKLEFVALENTSINAEEAKALNEKLRQRAAEKKRR